MVMGVLVVKMYGSDIEDSPADVGVLLKGLRVLGPQQHCVCDNHADGTEIWTELELLSRIQVHFWSIAVVVSGARWEVTIS